MANKNTKQTGNMGHHMWFWFPGLIVIILLVSAFWFIPWGGYKIAACSNSNLQLSAGQQSGAAGTIYQNIDLKNTGPNTCSISGYPTAFLYDANGYSLGGGAAARQNPAPVYINLAPGAMAHTTLGYPQAGNFNPGICTAASVSLKLFPPSAITPLDTPLAVPWCPGFSESSLQPGS